MRLVLLPGEYSVCRYPAGRAVSVPALPAGQFWSLTSTAEEVSLVCRSEYAASSRVESGWRLFMVEGPLDFGLVGVLAALSAVLAAAEISIFVVSTFDTDYLMVKSEKIEEAKRVLAAAGHSVRETAHAV